MSRAHGHDYKGIAALGRGQDTMLVHMTPHEVQSLQGIAAAHGGSLTINPETGYPEAGWLSSILPMVAAGILTATGVGAPAAAAIVAATSAAATGAEGGSWADALKAGALSGVGSAATAGLAGNLGSVGATAAEDAAKAAGTAAVEGTAATAAGEAATTGITGAAATTGINPTSLYASPALGEAAQAANTGLGINPASMYASQAANTGLGITAKMMPTPSALGEAAQAAQVAQVAKATEPVATMGSDNLTRTATGVGDWWKNLGARTSQNVGDISGGVKNLWNAADYSKYPGGGSHLLMQATGALSPIVSAGLSGDLNGSKKDKLDKFKSQYAPYMGPYTIQRPDMVQPGSEYYASNNTGDVNYFPGQSTFTSPAGPTFSHYAEGGIASLPDSQGGSPNAVEGMLSGPGDGMSDSIPANIDGKQEARLADGEFVIPADVVSHLGNGSSKSGSQRLYAMLDAVRQARTGNKEQGKQIDPSKYMPA